MDDLQAAFDRGFEAVKTYIDAELGALKVVSPDLAEQVASMVRLLHESPPIVERTIPPVTPRVRRIERDDDGNLVPIYND